MKENAAHAANDYIVYLMAGLGVTFAVHEYVGGLFFALSAAALARHINRDKDSAEIWVVLLTAFILSTVGAIFVHEKWPDIPVQVVMAALGFSSRFLVRIWRIATGQVEINTDKIIDRAVDKILPGDKK